MRPPAIATHEYRASGTIPALGETEKPAVSRLDWMRQGLASVRTDNNEGVCCTIG